MSEVVGRGEMPNILMILGLVMILGIVWLLFKMKRVSGEDRGEAVDRSKTPANSGSAAVVVEKRTQKKEKAKKPEKREKPVLEPSETVEKKESHLPILEEPVEELPGVDRKDFATYAGKQVLVVEDNKINQKLILTLLASSGIELEVADDGLVALEKLRDPSKHYDLVLMDINMPRMDGLEATREIRKDPNLREVPVVALTASTSEEEVEKILESGMNAYLDKPIVLGKLLHIFKIFTEQYQHPQRQSAGNVSAEIVSTDPDVLDVQTGLSYSNEDVSLYSMLLEDFRGNYGDSYERLSRMAKEKEYDAIEEVVVDLEGISGTLGAKRLHEQIRMIRQVIQQRTYGLLSDYLEGYREELQELLAEIDRFLSAR